MYFIKIEIMTLKNIDYVFKINSLITAVYLVAQIFLYSF